MNNKTDKLSKLILIYLPGTILPTIIGLLFTAIFTRTFNATDYGTYCYVITITTFIITMSSQWLQQSINRFIPQSLATDDSIKYNKIISFGIILILAILVTASVFSYFIIILFFPVWSPFYLPTAFFVTTSMVYNILISTLQAKLMAKQYAIFNFANASLKLLISYLVVIYIYHQPESLLWGTSIGILIAVPFLWNISGVATPFSLINSNTIQHLYHGLKEFISYGIPMSGWFLASVILNISDRYFIQLFRGAAEVGIYTANYSLVTGAASVLSMPITLAIHPFLMKSWNSGNKEQTSKLLALIVEIYITLGAFIIVIINIFSKDIVKILLGAEFREGHTILPIVICGIVAWQLSIYTHKPLEFMGRTIVMMWICALCAAVNILLNFIFIPKYGYIAAAYTTLTSFILYNLIVSTIGIKFVNWNLNLRRLSLNITLTCVIYYIIKFTRVILENTFTYPIELLISSVLICFMISLIILYNRTSILNITRS